MSAWAIIPALLGFKSRNGVLTFAPRLPETKLRLLFMTADGYGEYLRDERGVTIRMVAGTMKARALRFTLARQEVNIGLNGATWLPAGIHSEGKTFEITLPEDFQLGVGDVLLLTYSD